MHLNVTNAATALMGVTSIMPVSVDVMTKDRPTVTGFLSAASIVPEAISPTSSIVPGVTTTATILAPAASASTSRIETCGEWGDGAGPCARPYGRPNSTPEAWLSALSVLSLSEAPASATVPSGLSTTSLPIGIPANVSPAASSSSLAPASILDAPLSSSCALTATVFVTVTAANATAPASSGSGSGSTTYGTSTSLSIVTETAYANGTAAKTVVVTALNGTGALTTLTVPSYTLTLHTTVGPNGSAFSGAPSGVLTTSGGGKTVAPPKPLGMAGSSSGNGVYCVVMLVALAALLI